jgi:acyl carrier protein
MAVEPETDAELWQTVAPIWERVLGSEVHSPDDDFFMSGGDSLQLIDLVVEIGELYEVDFDYDRFLAAPTIGTLIAVLRDAGHT